MPPGETFAVAPHRHGPRAAGGVLDHAGRSVGVAQRAGLRARPSIRAAAGLGHGLCGFDEAENGRLEPRGDAK
jgi:hypothetical protein